MSRTIRSITARSKASSRKANTAAGPCCCGIAALGSRSNSDPEAAYRKGSLKFTLQGEKLHGNWALVRMGGKAANERHENWLLIKERDEEAVPQSGDAVVADNPLSVASGRSMDAIAADRDWVWHSNRDDNERPPAPTTGADHRAARHPRRPQRPDARQIAAAARDAWRTRRRRGRNGCTRSNTTATGCSPASRTARSG